MEHLYSGQRTSEGVDVTVDLEPLPLRLDLRNPPHAGFDWGDDLTSGAAQLALAILAHHCADDARALRNYQRFAGKTVAAFPDRNWAIESKDVERYLRACEAETFERESAVLRK